MKQKRNMKKTGVALLTTALVSSQLIAAVPFNVFAAEATPQTVKSVQATTENYYLNPITAGDRIITGKVDPSNKAVQIGSKALNSSGFNYGTEFDANGNFSTTN
ncbi:hypothetical protein [Listeria fleischmannii]|uniref:Uncharacterized protein n=1 Tax=Listeria fleischmannii FSL S10-1203 TaxID=1265822 RepID=W7D4T7_9LIST|nr:hypothetical protein [Listeria fleischmannii]EUJ44227.1 hypothetical protein MCOL2_19946 [Listeria fleischmannii FSL S10-1203]